MQPIRNNPHYALLLLPELEQIPIGISRRAQVRLMAAFVGTTDPQSACVCGHALVPPRSFYQCSGQPAIRKGVKGSKLIETVRRRVMEDEKPFWRKIHEQVVEDERTRESNKALRY